MGFHFIEGKPEEKVTLKKLEEILDKRDEQSKSFYSKACELFGFYSLYDVLHLFTTGLVGLAAARYLGVI